MIRWGRLLVAAALGNVAGILLARAVGPETLWVPILAGMAVPIGAMAALLHRQARLSTTLVALTALLLGGVNTLHHLDTAGPDHLLRFADDLPFGDETVVRGVLVAEPEIRARYTVLSVRPEEVVPQNGSAQRIGRGRIYARLYPDAQEQLGDLRYGDRIEITGCPLMQPRPSNNPGLFDQRRFLANQGYYGEMRIRSSYQLRLLPGGRAPLLVRASLGVKERILQVIRRTMPHPESAFLGGVLLGLRAGLPREIQDQFRAAGVSHVLAVSGLHVTIITLLFVGIFQAAGLPRRVSGPTIVMILVVFTIITGGRPSTLRAAIMNSVGILAYFVLGRSAKTSLIFGVSVASLAILARNPLILGEASFLFSFSAVLSLGLLSGPIERELRRGLHGPFRWLLLIWAVGLAGHFLASPGLGTVPGPILLGFTAVLPLSWLLARWLPRWPDYRRLPRWLTAFIAAQAAIQLGMGPLSAAYFGRVSLAAGLANFLAIPLIGLIVQLGLIAGLVGLIPGVGLFGALVMNAANWLGVKLFLGSAHFFAESFPYPHVRHPSSTYMTVHYGLLAVLAFRGPISEHLGSAYRLLRRALPGHRPLQLRVVGAGLMILAALALTGLGAWLPEDRPLEVTLLDPAVFGLGGGGATVIRAPGGQTLLVDGGARFVRTRDGEIDFDLGENLLVPFLLRQGLGRLDGMLLTSLRHGRVGGLPTAVRLLSVRELVLPVGLPVPETAGTEAGWNLADQIRDPRWSDSEHRWTSQRADESFRDLLRECRSREIPIRSVGAGEVLLDETDPRDQPVRVEVLWPPATGPAGTVLDEGCLVLMVIHGQRRVLLTSDLAGPAQLELIRSGTDLGCDIMVAPGGGRLGHESQELLDAAKPSVVVLQVRTDRQDRRMVSRAARWYADRVSRVIRTDRAGAVVLTSDGQQLRLRTVQEGIEEVLP